MNFDKKFCLLVILCLSTVNYSTTELITVSLIGSAILAGGWFSWDTLKEGTYCRYKECCNEAFVPYNVDNFKKSLTERVFGQPLVNELANILTAHKESIYNKEKNSRKALVLSFHGWSGVGKNYVATIIAESLYKKGMESSYVKLYMGKKDFDCSGSLEEKKRELASTLSEIVQKCPKSLIIFDEIHDMCPSVLDAIKPMMDHHHAVDGIDFRQSIFIFISNIGGQEISTNLLELYGQGVKRNDIEFHYFEPIIRRTAYQKGGFEKAGAIAQHLIDHYIPFLPMEQHHVEMCALAEFQRQGIFAPTEQMMEDALTVIVFGPTEDQAIFANNGCKRLTKHVPFIVQKYKKKDEL